MNDDIVESLSLLAEAIDRQSEAIMALAEQNQLLIMAMADDEHADEQPRNYMDGSPL